MHPELRERTVILEAMYRRFGQKFGPNGHRRCGRCMHLVKHRVPEYDPISDEPTGGTVQDDACAVALREYGRAPRWRFDFLACGQWKEATDA